jgi:hypothetical protein
MGVLFVETQAVMWHKKVISFINKELCWEVSTNVLSKTSNTENS